MRLKSSAQSDSIPKIVAVLPRGEAIRNFVYTGALDEVARHSELTLLSVIPNDDFEELLASRYQRLLPLRLIRDSVITETIREVLNLAHGRLLWSEAWQFRWELRDKYWVGRENAYLATPGRRAKRLLKKLACFPFANTTGLMLLSKLEQKSSCWLRTTNEFLNLFRQIKPDLVFNGSHVHSQLAIQAIKAAQWLGIPTATFIFSWDNLTSQGRIIPLYDYYLVWSELIRDQLLQIYPSVRPSQIFVTGTPQFDFHFREEFYWTREEFCARVGADPKRPIILYSTGMAHHMPGEPEIVSGIADMLQGMSELGPPQLLVRVYPKDTTQRFEPLKLRRQDILFPNVPWETSWMTPEIEDLYLLTNTLRHAALGINVASTVSLELCMFDKPVINVAYNWPGIDNGNIDFKRYYRFDHYRPVVKSGAITVVQSEHEMRDAILKCLTQPEAGREERRQLIKSMFNGSLDGKAGLRVAERLISLAGRRGSELNT